MKILEVVDFEKSTDLLGKNHPVALPLPVHVVREGEDKGCIIACMEVTPEQLEDMARTGRLWIRFQSYGHPVTPFCVHTGSPFPDELQREEREKEESKQSAARSAIRNKDDNNNLC